MADEEALKARLAELAAKREARAAEAATSAELRALELEVADAEAIEKAELEHGVEGRHIAIIRTELGCVIVKRPTGAAYQRFADSKGETPNGEALVKSCRVHPDPVALGRILSERPGVLVQIVKEACALAGHRREEVTGKS